MKRFFIIAALGVITFNLNLLGQAMNTGAHDEMDGAEVCLIMVECPHHHDAEGAKHDHHDDHETTVKCDCKHDYSPSVTNPSVMPGHIVELTPPLFVMHGIADDITSFTSNTHGPPERPPENA